jgi:hypothetical protein
MILAEPVVPSPCFFHCTGAMGEAFTRHSLRPLAFRGWLRQQLGRDRAAGALKLGLENGDALSAVMPRFKRGIQ